MLKRLIIVVLAMSVLTACQDAFTQSKSSEGYKVSVSYNGQVHDFYLEDLKKLPVHNVTIAGVGQDGPYLNEVLAAAGIKQYETVKLVSKSGDITLPKNQVDQQTILDFTNHGTVKLATTHVEKNKWVKDIAEIEVK